MTIAAKVEPKKPTNGQAYRYHVIVSDQNDRGQTRTEAHITENEFNRRWPGQDLKECLAGIELPDPVEKHYQHFQPEDIVDIFHLTEHEDKARTIPPNDQDDDCWMRRNFELLFPGEPGPGRPRSYNELSPKGLDFLVRTILVFEDRNEWLDIISHSEGVDPIAKDFQTKAAEAAEFQLTPLDFFHEASRP